jgi:hypothetical protein
MEGAMTREARASVLKVAAAAGVLLMCEALIVLSMIF